MIPFGQLLIDIGDQINNPMATADASLKKQLSRKINEAYREVCGLWPWTALEDTVTLPSTYMIPADCAVPRKVKDDDDNWYTFQRNKQLTGNLKNYNWYWGTPIATALADGNDLAVGEYDVTLTSASSFPATTCAGEYIRIGMNMGIYKIDTWTSASLMTIVENFRGDTLDAAVFAIRPVGTRVLAFMDSAGTGLTPTDVEFTYTKIPLPLYRDEDLLVLPGDCGAVKAKCYQKMKGMFKFSDPGMDFDDEMDKMKSQEPLPAFGSPRALFRTNTTDAQRLNRWY